MDGAQQHSRQLFRGAQFENSKCWLNGSIHALHEVGQWFEPQLRCQSNPIVFYFSAFEWLKISDLGGLGSNLAQTDRQFAIVSISPIRVTWVRTQLERIRFPSSLDAVPDPRDLGSIPGFSPTCMETLCGPWLPPIYPNTGTPHDPHYTPEPLIADMPKTKQARGTSRSLG